MFLERVPLIDLAVCHSSGDDNVKPRWNHTALRRAVRQSGCGR